MVQILPPKTSLGTALGQAFSQGVAPGIERGINRGQLSQALEKLGTIDPSNYAAQLATILPALLTTPGGAQAAPEILERLGAFSQNAALTSSIEKRRQELRGRGEQGQGVTINNISPQPQQLGQGQLTQEQPQPQFNYKRPTTPSSERTTFPQATAGPQPQPEMSQPQQENYALDIMQQSMLNGKPITFPEAMSIARGANKDIRDSNEQIQREKDRREAAQQAITASAITRAKNAGLIKDPEDVTVAEKLALQAPFAENENQRYEYVRTKMKQFDEAKRAITSELDLANPLSKTFRQAVGTYKEKEQLIKDLQPKLKFFREHGLFDEGKALMVDALGFGNELANTAMFPFTKEQVAETDAFPKNTKELPLGGALSTIRKQEFPDESYALDQDQFNKFKDRLSGFLEKNPDVNLATLRGKLNQEKRYDWHDIYKAIDQLVDERRFNPDLEQEKQLTTLRQPPAPGMIEFFKYLWTGKK